MDFLPNDTKNKLPTSALIMVQAATINLYVIVKITIYCIYKNISSRAGSGLLQIFKFIKLLWYTVGRQHSMLFHLQQMDFIWLWKAKMNLKVSCKVLAWPIVHETWIQRAVWAALPTIGSDWLACYWSPSRPPRPARHYVIKHQISVSYKNSSSHCPAGNFILNKTEGTT